ncbi:ligand-binding sensor domain-containing protein [Methylacidiphilum caldifontis]|uniref:Uncharacterized protein n=1 Tax=Methylacidiphilum caldifontis TaxID=2795386 RepID=A0A4Y8PB18_9BACT|nr:WD40 repeat domain-containing protein [Methylacidiphilum caldifontis]TFE67712.1 hypothetical protein A7Q10_09135 [Methylacidiphilum caldifontis]
MNFFKKFPTIFVLPLFLFLPIPEIHAIHPQRIILDSYNDFAQGTSESVEIKAEGFLTPSPFIEKICSLPAEQAWSILAESYDSCLIGTSPEGKLFRVKKDGSYQLIAKFPEGNVSALTKNKKGEIFVGTSPDGKIYKIEPNGHFKVFFDPKEKYIWSMICDDKSNLYVGTGTAGRIYRLTEEAKGEIYATVSETHVRCLLLHPTKETLLAATANRGAVYEIFPGGKAILLVDPEKDEINQLVVGDNHCVYFSTVGKKKFGRLPNQPQPDSSSLLPEGWIEVSGEQDENKEYPSSKTQPLVNIKPTIPPRLSEIWKIETSGLSYPIWSSKDFVFAIQWFKNRLFIGSDSGGYIYAVDTNGKMDRVLKTDSSQLNAFALSGNQLFISSSNPIHIYLTGESMREREAIYRSWPIDAGSIAKWGSIRLEKEGNVEVLTRTGNTHRAEAGWYGWQPLVDNHCTSPSGRYLQFELRLGKNAKVSRVEIACLPNNIPPKIELLKILPPGISYSSLMMPPPPPPTKTIEQLLSHDEKSTDFESQSMPPRFQVKESRGLRTVVWKAIDPDGDNLKYSIFFKPYPSSAIWTLLAKELDESLFSWDTTGWPDGFYVLKIEATDEKDNPLGMGLSASLESRPFLVDNTPPKILIQNKDNAISITVTDEGSGIKTVEISEDGKTFTPLYPKEGMLDFRKQEFVIGLTPEKKIRFIRAEDESGNISNALLNN